MNENSNVPRPWQPRFSIALMMLLMLIVCVMAAAGSYFARSFRDNTNSSRLIFILFTLVGPMLLMILVGIVRMAIAWTNRKMK